MAVVTHPQTPELTHLRHDGTAQMVDVSAKAATVREATATGTVHTTATVMALLGAGELPKGDALAVARVAGIMAAKKTPELIPLCHPLPLSKVTVDFELDPTAVIIEATVKTRGVTGVEMEALTAVSVAALSVYDMVKAVDKHAVISGIQVLAKSGGKSGDWTAVPDGSVGGTAAPTTLPAAGPAAGSAAGQPADSFDGPFAGPGARA